MTGTTTSSSGAQPASTDSTGSAVRACVYTCGESDDFTCYEIMVFAHTTIGEVLSVVLNIDRRDVHCHFCFGEHVSEAITAEVCTDITVPESKFFGGADFDPNALLINRIRRFSPYVVVVT